QTPDVSRQVVATDDVEHDIHTAIFGDGFDFFNEVPLSVIDREPGTDSLTRLTLFVGSCGRIDGGMECMGQLNSRCPDPARAAMHQDRLARAEAAVLEEIGPDSEIRFWN